MRRPVEVASSVFDTIDQRFGEERTPAGAPSGYDFIGGPLAAAVFAFRDFDELPYDPIPAVRVFTVVDPFFGAVTFSAVLRSDDVVEVAGFADDPDYWTTIDRDPE